MASFQHQPGETAGPLTRRCLLLAVFGAALALGCSSNDRLVRGLRNPRTQSTAADAAASHSIVSGPQQEL